MKIALVHDYLREWGGAEEVLSALHDLYPDAPVYTSYQTDKIKLDKSWHIETSKYNPIFRLFNRSHVFTPLLPIAFRQFDFSGYDVVISSSSAFAKSVRVNRPTTHLCYCHTIPRFLYGLERERRPSLFLDLIEKFVRPYLKKIDLESAAGVDHFMANSYVVAQRIHEVYGKGAMVIYPPVNTEKFEIRKMKPEEKTVILNQVGEESDGDLAQKPHAPFPLKSEGGKQKYYVIMGRLSLVKHFDLAVQVCRNLNLQLKVIGEGQDMERLRSMAGPTVEFLGRLSDADAAQVLAGCEAVLSTMLDEDFGILPIEILGIGKPVISFASAAAKETLLDGVTGPFFYEPTVESLQRVLANFDGERYDAEALRDHAAKFSKERFIKEVKEFVERFGESAAESKKPF